MYDCSLSLSVILIIKCTIFCNSDENLLAKMRPYHEKPRQKHLAEKLMDIELSETLKQPREHKLYGNKFNIWSLADGYGQAKGNYFLRKTGEFLKNNSTSFKFFKVKVPLLHDIIMNKIQIQTLFVR